MITLTKFTCTPINHGSTFIIISDWCGHTNIIGPDDYKGSYEIPKFRVVNVLDTNDTQVMLIPVCAGLMVNVTFKYNKISINKLDMAGKFRFFQHGLKRSLLDIGKRILTLYPHTDDKVTLFNRIKPAFEEYLVKFNLVNPRVSLL